MFPSNPIQNHPIFQYKAYLPFTQKVKTCLQQEEEGPSQLLILYQAIPAIADCLKTIDAQNNQRAHKNNQRARELQALFNCIAKSQQTQSLQLQLLTFSSLTFWLKAPLASIYLCLTAYLPTVYLLTAHLLTAYLLAPPLSITELSQYALAQVSAIAFPLLVPP